MLQNDHTKEERKKTAQQSISTPYRKRPKFIITESNLWPKKLGVTMQILVLPLHVAARYPLADQQRYH
jgi:hypothetical protein